MNSEQFEFAISQYIDGTLPIEQRAEVEDRLRADPEARKLLEEYQKLNQAIVASAEAMPRVRWDRLAQHLSEVVNEAGERRNYSIAWVRTGVGLAMAASVLIVLGIFLRHPATPMQPQAVAVIDVSGPSAQAAAGPQSVDVSVDVPREASADFSADSVLAQRPMVALAGFTQ